MYLKMDSFKELKRLNNMVVRVKSGISFHQETAGYLNNRFTNFYWIEIDKEVYNFKIESNRKRIPLIDFDKDNRNVIAGINFGSFLITDKEYNQRCSYTNLVVSKGKVLQFPSNSRICIYSDGKSIDRKYIHANGVLHISNKEFSWSGMNSNENTDLKIIGMFDMDCKKVSNKSGRKEIVINEDTNLIHASNTESILGIKVDSGIPKVSSISNDKLDILQYDYAIKGNRDDLEGINTGDIVESITFGSHIFNNDINASSGSFELGKNIDELKNNLYRDLVIQKNRIPKPMDPEYIKSWSVVLECEDKYVFCINDARPSIYDQRGITVFELQEYLLDKFKYIWGVVGDSGQSSKLMFVKDGKRNIFGNLHYINYNSASAYWDGINGRPISTAILAYE